MGDCCMLEPIEDLCWSQRAIYSFNVDKLPHVRSCTSFIDNHIIIIITTATSMTKCNSERLVWLINFPKNINSIISLGP